MNSGERLLDFISRGSNVVAIILLVTIVAATLLGISSAKLLDVDVWLRAAAEFLRKL